MQFEEYKDLLQMTHFKFRINGLRTKEGLENYLNKLRVKCGGKAEVKSKVKTLAAIYPVDLIDAAKDLEDPVIYAKIMESINKELCKNGNPYDISNNKVRILGLTNRYIENAQIAKYNRQWRQFAFYMRAVAYYIPQLLLEADIRDADLILKASIAKENNMEWFENLPNEYKDFLVRNKTRIKDIIEDIETVSGADMGNRKTLSKKN